MSDIDLHKHLIGRQGSRLALNTPVLVIDRDALQRNDLPTIDALTNSGKYFPYRYGEALWAFIGGTWGDEKVTAFFKSALEVGIDQAAIKTLGMRTDTLSKRWHAAIRTTAATSSVLTGKTTASGCPGACHDSPWL